MSGTNNPAFCFWGAAWLSNKQMFLSIKPVNNIELGCAYLSQIRYHYFENIKDDELAYICSIPAYNTGIGNVSKTLCGKPYTNPAADVANSMTADELYKKLTSDLKYEEARNYLERVWKYKEKYKG